jgi:hypothetical protein
MTANTPDNCYLDKGHDAHDLLGPGESCKACGFVAPDADVTQQDRDAAALALTVSFPSPGGGSYRMTGLRVGDDSTAETNLTEQVARAIARARHAGEVAERVRLRDVFVRLETAGRDWQEGFDSGCQSLTEEAANLAGIESAEEFSRLVCRECDAAIRSLAPATEVKP